MTYPTAGKLDAGLQVHPHAESSVLSVAGSGASGAASGKHTFIAGRVMQRMPMLNVACCMHVSFVSQGSDAASDLACDDDHHTLAS